MYIRKKKYIFKLQENIAFGVNFLCPALFGTARRHLTASRRNQEAFWGIGTLLILILRLVKSENWQKARDSLLRKSATGSRTGDKGIVQLNIGTYLFLIFPQYFFSLTLYCVNRLLRIIHIFKSYVYFSISFEYSIFFIFVRKIKSRLERWHLVHCLYCRWNIRYPLFVLLGLIIMVILVITI